MSKKEVVKTKKKLIAGDLIPKPYKLTVVHDDYEDTWVEINARESSLDFYIAAAKFMALDPADHEGQLRTNNDVVASTISGWDEEAFGPHSPDKAKEMMSNPVFWWVRDQISAALDVKTNFFKNA